MALGVGIVGLPNVGKSTLFNALTRTQQAAAENYPFCTIEPNKAIVPVPDDRLEKIAAICKPPQVIHAVVEFIDIAGLVRGASKGEGLGNQFLGNIREVDAILHVVRCFEDENIVHVDGAVDPLRDIGVVETELILADLQSLEKRLDRIGRQARADVSLRKEVEAMEALKRHLDSGKPASLFPRSESDAIVPCLTELQLLTDKRVVYCANVGEGEIGGTNPHVEAVRAHAAQVGAEVVVIAARVEADLAGLTDAERLDFLASYGLKESGLDQTIRQAYRALDRISFFTHNEKDARAWTIHKGWKAPKAAGVIHTDFERGFIRAEVIGYDDYMRLGGEAACRQVGMLRVEGKEYVVQDGDVIHFLFNT